MATVIVNSSVWYRVHKYYDNVETKYPNTWDINDTIEQIEKIQWVICNFENVCIWSREPIIPSWKRNGWKETWHKISPWHFAFEYKVVDGRDYIFIQDAEHQDDIKESHIKIKQRILDNKCNHTTKKTIHIKESDLIKLVMECVNRVIMQ